MLEDIVKKLNLTPEQLDTLKEAASKGPMEIMQAVQKAGISPEVFQQIMALVMSNPNILNELADKFGVPQNIVDQAKNSIKKDPEG